MLWLSLLYYAALGQPVWIQDGPTVDDAWFCQVVAVLPDAVLVRIDNAGAPYLITIPLREVRAVRERHPDADARYLEALVSRRNESGPDGLAAPR